MITNLTIEIQEDQIVYILGKRFIASDIALVDEKPIYGKIWHFTGTATDSDRNDSIKGTGYEKARYSITQLNLEQQTA
jgi:hypothetical protein